MKKNILIVGGSGFLGLNLIEYLYKSSKYNLISISRGINKDLKLRKKINYIRADLSIYKNLERALRNKKIDVVINFGGNIEHNNKRQTNNSHYQLCKNLVNYFSKKKLSLFIQAGSSMEYGTIKSPNLENKKTKPNSIYGISKLKSTKYLEQSEINYVILRLYQIYGPYQKFDRLIPLAIKNLLSDKNFNSSNGLQVRDFLYVDDFILLINKILKKKNIKKGIYNVGSGRPTNVKTVLTKIEKLISKSKINFNAIKMRKEEIKYLYPNINKVKRSFNWTPKTSLTNGLKKTINFYEK